MPKFVFELQTNCICFLKNLYCLFYSFFLQKNYWKKQQIFQNSFAAIYCRCAYSVIAPAATAGVRRRAGVSELRVNVCVCVCFRAYLQAL